MVRYGKSLKAWGGWCPEAIPPPQHNGRTPTEHNIKSPLKIIVSFTMNGHRKIVGACICVCSFNRSFCIQHLPPKCIFHLRGAITGVILKSSIKNSRNKYKNHRKPPITKKPINQLATRKHEYVCSSRVIFDGKFCRTLGGKHLVQGAGDAEATFSLFLTCGLCVHFIVGSFFNQVTLQLICHSKTSFTIQYVIHFTISS